MFDNGIRLGYVHRVGFGNGDGFYVVKSSFRSLMWFISIELAEDYGRKRQHYLYLHFFQVINVFPDDVVTTYKNLHCSSDGIPTYTGSWWNGNFLIYIFTVGGSYFWIKFCLDEELITELGLSIDFRRLSSTPKGGRGSFGVDSFTIRLQSLPVSQFNGTKRENSHVKINFYFYCIKSERSSKLKEVSIINSTKNWTRNFYSNHSVVTSEWYHE